MKRTVTATLVKPDLNPWSNIPIEFNLINGTAGAGVVVPSNKLIINTDGAGQLSADLWVDKYAANPYYYQARLPGEIVAFPLLPGAPIDISFIKELWSIVIMDPQQVVNGQVPAGTPPITDPVSQQLATTALHVYNRVLWQLNQDLESIVGKLVEARLANALVGDRNFVYTQSIPAKEWIIDHPLDKKPSVVTVNKQGERLDGVVHYGPVTDKKRVRVTFFQPHDGYAFLN